MTDQPFFIIKRGDRLPAFRARCLDGDTPVNLTGATVKFVMRSKTAVVVDSAAVVEDQAQTDTRGWVRYDWDTDDTIASGNDYVGEIEVTWPGGKKQTFPPDRNVRIYVMPDLG